MKRLTSRLVKTVIRLVIMEIAAKINGIKIHIDEMNTRRKRERFYAFSFTKYVADHAESHDLFSYHAYVSDNRRKFHTLVMGLELCPTTGKPHVQGYIFFEEPITLHAMYVRFPNCHIEPSREGPMANYKYCSKANYVLKIGSVDKAELLWNNILTRGERGAPVHLPLG